MTKIEVIINKLAEALNEDISHAEGFKYHLWTNAKFSKAIEDIEEAKRLLSEVLKDE